MKLAIRLISLLFIMALLPVQIAIAAPAGQGNDLVLTPQQQPQQQQQQPNSPGQGTTAVVPAAPPAMQLHDIYPPVELPTPIPSWVWAAGAGALIGCALLIAYLVKRSRRKVIVPPPTPEAVALSAMEQARTLFDQGDYARYAEALSSILRRYLEVKFQLYSTRRTSTELLAMLKVQTNPVILQSRELIAELLQQADMAKFARQTPDAESLLTLASGLIRLVNSSVVPVIEGDAR